MEEVLELLYLNEISTDDAEYNILIIEIYINFNQYNYISH